MSKEFKCKRCGYDTDYRHSMISHLNKKNPCETKLDHIPRDELLKEFEKKKAYKCENCNQTYSLMSNLRRHLKICDKKTIELIQLKHEVNNIIKDIKYNFDYKNIVKNIKTLGNETAVQITNERFKAIISMDDDMYAQAIKDINFNDNYPENWNILLTDITSNNLEIYEDNSFVSREIEQAIDNIITNIKNYLLKELDNRQTDLSCNIIQYERYKTNIEFYGNVISHTKNEKYERVIAIKRIMYINSNKISPLKEVLSK
jgi:hypothetical protein